MEKVAEDEGVEPLTISNHPGFRDRLPAYPAASSTDSGGGNRDRTYAPFTSGLGLATRHFTAQSALRDQRDEVLDDEVKLRMAGLYTNRSTAETEVK